MKKATVCFLLVITAIFISACGNKSNAPENVREDVWNHGIQFAIFMKDTINEEISKDSMKLSKITLHLIKKMQQKKKY